MYTSCLLSIFSISPGTVAPDCQSSAGVLLHILQVWVLLAPDRPSFTSCFNLLQDRGVKGLIFDTVFNNFYYKKWELACLFLVSHQLLVNRAVPVFSVDPCC